MTALADIAAALKRCPPKREGWARCVMVGPSAMLALGKGMGDGRIVRADLILPPRIGGAQVHATDEFPGWSIRDLDTNGKWHDVELVA